MTSPLQTALLAALLVVVPVAAYADAADDAIKARRGYFQLMKHNAGMLFAMAKGDVAYDAAAAQSRANNLGALAGMDIRSLWPAGSDNDAKFGDTRAQPVIWKDMAGFEQKFIDFQKASVGLSAAAGSGLDALRGAVGPLGQSCKGCHDDYRAKDF